MNKLGKLLVKYLETPGSSAGESPWQADSGKEVGGVASMLAYGFVQLWILLAAAHYALADGLLIGALTLGVLFACCNVKWRKMGNFSTFGSIIGGAISALLLVNIIYTCDGSSIGIFAIMIGWIASGVLNVRYSFYFWGNPMVGEGTGAFFTFIMGPAYFLLWSLFFIVAVPLELGVNACYDWGKKKSK